MSETHAARPARLALRIVNLLGFLGTVAMNALAVTIPLGGKSVSELSDSYPNLFVPARLTFSIWGVIYILLAIYAVHQLVFQRGYVDRIGWLFALASAANMGWIAAWQERQVALSMLVMLVLLASLISIYVRLFIGRSAGTAAEKWIESK